MNKSELKKLKLDIKLTKKCAERYLGLVVSLEEATTFEARKSLIKTIQLGASVCALCNQYNTDDHEEEDAECDGCPVKYKTGEPICGGTPYDPIRGLSLPAMCLKMRRWDAPPSGYSRLYSAFTNRCRKEAVFLGQLAAELESKLPA